MLSAVKPGKALLRVAMGVGGVLVANLVVLVLLQQDVLHAGQVFFDDLLLRQSAGQQPLGPIVIAAIDDASVKAYGPPEAWDRSHYAALIRNARKDGARAIGFDVSFANPAQGDEDLATAIEESMRPTDGSAPMPVILGVLGMGQARPSAGKGLGFSSFQEIAPDVAKGRPIRAALNVELDGGVARELALNVFSGAEQYQPLPLLAANAYAAGTLDLKGGYRLETNPNRLGFGCSAETGACTYEVPTDELFEMRVAYDAAPGAYARQAVSLSSIADGQADPAAVRDKLVLVGAFPSKDGYAVPTSVDVTMPRVEIWANLAQSLLSGRFIAPQPLWTTAAIMLVLSVVAAGCFLRFGAFGWIAALSLVLIASAARYVLAAAQLATPANGHEQITMMPEFLYVDAAVILSSAALCLCLWASNRRACDKGAPADANAGASPETPA